MYIINLILGRMIRQLSQFGADMRVDQVFRNGFSRQKPKFNKNRKLSVRMKLVQTFSTAHLSD